MRGDRGMALIYTLQQRLKDLGYYTIRVDGIYGSATQRAIRWFQEVNGLSVTGKADHATQQLLYSFLCQGCRKHGAERLCHAVPFQPLSRGGRAASAPSESTGLSDRFD